MAGEPEAGAVANAPHVAVGHLPAAQHQTKIDGAPGLSLSVEECENHPTQPGVGRGHYKPAYGPWILYLVDWHSRRCSTPTREANAPVFFFWEFTHVLQDRGERNSMDGKGQYSDNIFGERL